ncbi:MAG: hypothetical protein ACYCW6_15105 [Candidatus Xenobia bacterium]
MRRLPVMAWLGLLLGGCGSAPTSVAPAISTPPALRTFVFAANTGDVTISAFPVQNLATGALGPPLTVNNGSTNPSAVAVSSDGSIVASFNPAVSGVTVFDFNAATEELLLANNLGNVLNNPSTATSEPNSPFLFAGEVPGGVQSMTVLNGALTTTPSSSKGQGFLPLGATPSSLATAPSTLVALTAATAGNLASFRINSDGTLSATGGVTVGTQAGAASASFGSLVAATDASGAVLICSVDAASVLHPVGTAALGAPPAALAFCNQGTVLEAALSLPTNNIVAVPISASGLPGTPVIAGSIAGTPLSAVANNTGSVLFVSTAQGVTPGTVASTGSVTFGTTVAGGINPASLVFLQVLR